MAKDGVVRLATPRPGGRRTGACAQAYGGLPEEQFYESPVPWPPNRQEAHVSVTGSAGYRELHDVRSLVNGTTSRSQRRDRSLHSVCWHLQCWVCGRDAVVTFDLQGQRNQLER